MESRFHGRRICSQVSVPTENWVIIIIIIIIIIVIIII
jgi:hypothetical protein